MVLGPNIFGNYGIILYKKNNVKKKSLPTLPIFSNMFSLTHDFYLTWAEGSRGAYVMVGHLSVNTFDQLYLYSLQSAG